PLRVVLVRDRRAEQRENAIPQSLRDIPLIAMNSVHHELQGRVNNGARLFGVEAFDERRGAFEISKQRGDGLALAVGGPARLHGCLLSGDALGQMWRRVAHWEVSVP